MFWASCVLARGSRSGVGRVRTVQLARILLCLACDPCRKGVEGRDPSPVLNPQLASQLASVSMDIESARVWDCGLDLSISHNPLITFGLFGAACGFLIGCG